MPGCPPSKACYSARPACRGRAAAHHRHLRELAGDNQLLLAAEGDYVIQRLYMNSAPVHVSGGAA